MQSEVVLSAGSLSTVSLSSVLSLSPIKELAQALFRGNITPEEIKKLRPQTLYLALLELGLESAADVLDLVSDGQYEILSDLSWWRGDQFCDQRFFAWLAAIDRGDSLEPLEKLLRSIGPEVLALLASRYLAVEVREEASEISPGEGWYTPDRGMTWLMINEEDPERHRLLGKFLAYLFQRDAELFYRIALTHGGETPLELEERCFQEKNARLQAEGLPGYEEALEKQLPLELPAQKNISPKDQPGEHSPVARNSHRPLEALKRLLEEIESQRGQEAVEEFQGELALLANALLLLSETLSPEETAEPQPRELAGVIASIAGLINIGLELALCSGRAASELYQEYRLQGLYRLGMGKVRELRKALAQVQPEKIAAQPLLQILQREMCKRIPGVPQGMLRELSEAPGEPLSQDEAMRVLPLQGLGEVVAATKYLESQKKW